MHLLLCLLQFILDCPMIILRHHIRTSLRSTSTERTLAVNIVNILLSKLDLEEVWSSMPFLDNSLTDMVSLILFRVQYIVREGCIINQYRAIISALKL